MTYNNITKGKEFTVTLVTEVNIGSSNIFPHTSAFAGYSTYIISKDGGAFQSTTNKGIYIDKGIQTITLTADEMNADRIDVIAKHYDAGLGYIAPASIFTGKAIKLTDEIIDIESSSNVSKNNPSVSEVLAFLWAIFRKRGQKRNWTEIKKFIR